MRSRVKSSLPHDILFDEILARLPVKQLLCFKTVCRSWCLTISSPDFAKTHLKFSSSRQVFVIDVMEGFHSRGFRSLHLLPYNKECNDSVDNFNGLVRLTRKFSSKREILVGSCNGILCLAFFEKHDRVKKYVICNPATHKDRVIDNPYEDFEAICLGFGYISSIDDYKITAIYYDSKEKVNHVYHYSLKTGTWTRVVADDVPLNDLTTTMSHMLFYKEKIHWMNNNKTIVAIDLISEKWVQHSLDNMYNKYEYMNMFMAEQQLALLGVGHDGSCYDVWMMDNNKDDVVNWNSWKKAFSADKFRRYGIRFLNATENGIILTDSSFGEKFHVYDATGKTSPKTYFSYFKSIPPPNTAFYYDTLISPFP